MKYICNNCDTVFKILVVGGEDHPTWFQCPVCCNCDIRFMEDDRKENA